MSTPTVDQPHPTGPLSPSGQTAASGQTGPGQPTPAPDRTVRHPRGWAWAGTLAGLASIASIQLSLSLTPAYTGATPPTPEEIAAQLGQGIPQLIAFHVVTVAAALLLLVFAAGLKRRLDVQAPAGSILPSVAGFGLVVLSAVQVLGSGLNTEFVFGLATPELMVATDVSIFSHWIATIPWLWVTGGLSAVALGAAAMRGAAPKWLGVVSLVLGGLTMIIGVSPLQYMAGFVGPLWLLVAALGFALGDRNRR